MISGENSNSENLSILNQLWIRSESSNILYERFPRKQCGIENTCLLAFLIDAKKRNGDLGFL